jgi:hypothetical protein
MRSLRTSVRERTRRSRVSGGRVRVTKPGRKLNAVERAEAIKQMQDAGRLGREVR